MIAGALVIGGGIAGSALAARLAAAGRETILCERESGPCDKVCGEFLSREAVLYLEDLGIDLPGLGAVAIEGVRLFDGRPAAEMALPFSALSLSRRVLDEALLCRAGALGAQIRRGFRVQGLDRGPDLWRARGADGTELVGRTAFLATGKHDLRGMPRPKGLQNDLVGFKQYFVLSDAARRALDRHVELHLFPGGYAGLQPVEGGRANLCLVVRRRSYAALGQDWAALLSAIAARSPAFADRMDRAAPQSDRPWAIAGIPYGMVRRDSDGVWRVGDQAAVIPSFSGDGMSIALHAAHLAASRYCAGDTAEGFQRRLAADIGGPVRLATALSILSVTGPGRRAIGLAAGLAPRLVSLVAGATRVPDPALRRSGFAIG